MNRWTYENLEDTVAETLQNCWIAESMGAGRANARQGRQAAYRCRALPKNARAVWRVESPTAAECGWVLPKVTERRMIDCPTANF